MATDLRTKIFQAIDTDAQVIAFGGERWAFGTWEEVPEARPLVVLKFGTANRVFPDCTATDQNFQVWVHDLPGDYSRIDAVLSRVEFVLRSLMPLEQLIQIDWSGRSPDLTDPDWGTILRWSAFSVAASTPS